MCLGPTSGRGCSPWGTLGSVCRLLLILSALACGVDSIRPCPASGPGAVVARGRCFVFTPAAAGANPAGQNATIPNYALEPSSTPSGALVLLLNGSGGSP